MSETLSPPTALARDPSTPSKVFRRGATDSCGALRLCTEGPGGRSLTCAAHELVAVGEKTQTVNEAKPLVRSRPDAPFLKGWRLRAVLDGRVP